MDEIVGIIDSELSKLDNLDDIEMEVRLGIFDVGGKLFEPNIGDENYDLINGMLESYDGWKSTTSNYTNYYGPSNLRLTIDSNGTTKCIEKTRIKNFTFVSENLPFDFRVSISREKNVPVSKFPKAKSKLKNREKVTKYWYHQNASFELSKIIYKEENGEVLESVEYEIEHKGDFSKKKEAIFQMLYKSLDAIYHIDGFTKTKDLPLPIDTFQAILADHS